MYISWKKKKMFVHFASEDVLYLNKYRALVFLRGLQVHRDLVCKVIVPRHQD